MNETTKQAYCLKSNIKPGKRGLVHWANPTRSKIQRFKDEYGDDFNIVFYRTESPMETYAIPFTVLSTVLTESHLQPNKKRWITKIVNGILKIHIRGTEVQTIDVSMYLEAVLTTEVRNEDCASGMKDIPTESVALIVTSPPYKDEDGYSDELMRNWLKQAHRVLKPDSCLFLNFGHLTRMKGRGYRVATMAEDAGFTWNDTITWVKNHYTPLNIPYRVNNLTEYIFLLTKGKPKLDKLSVAVPYGMPWTVNPGEPAPPNEAAMKRWGRNSKCGGNVWYIKYETISPANLKRHKDRFPIELPLRALKLAGVEGTVVDPFCGSGTTGTACVEYWKEDPKRISFIGFELNPTHVETAMQWWAEQRAGLGTPLYEPLRRN